jgi:hypothetical protein
MKVHIFKLNRKDTINLVLKFLAHFFFFLDEKETKSQDERPTPIFPAKASLNGGSLSFAKINRTITNI